MKLHHRLFGLLILLLPTQLAWHFWPEWATIFGIRVDYLAPKIYLTDLIVISLLVSWLFSVRKKLPITLLLCIFVTLNILSSIRWQVALVSWLKVGEVVLLGLYVYGNWQILKDKISLPLTLALVYVFGIAVLQLIFQKTIGGPFWFLGEREFAAATPGIALVSVFGQQIMRPYSVFSHPNQMAGFVLAILPLTGNFLASILAVLIVAISFSQGAWAAALMIIAFGIATIKRRRRLLALPALLVIGSLLQPLIPPGFIAGPRLTLAQQASRLFAQTPLFGVGLGNFIPAMSSLSGFSRYLQPVHNIFLLVATETGIVGLVVFFVLVIKSLKNSLKIGNWKLVSALLAILLTGFVDHYWLTLQQTQLLFGIVVGACLASTVTGGRGGTRGRRG